jgi:hypothetical protein
MDNFNEYLNGSRFTLYRDTSVKTALSTTQVKTLNRLRTTMNEHDFETKDRRGSDLPNSLKKSKNSETREPMSQDKAFNGNIHVDLIDTQAYPGETIKSITNDSQTFTTAAVIPDSGLGSVILAIWKYWCEPFGLPVIISFKQGKVQTSKLEKRFNDLAPLKQKINYQSRKDTFNKEIQWQQNQHELSGEEFVQAWNFLNDLQKPAMNAPWTFEVFNNTHEDPMDDEDLAEDSNEHEIDLLNLLHLNNDQPTNLKKRKQVSLCWHKLQRRPGYRSRIWKQPAERVTEFTEEDIEDEWAQLREMEQLLAKQKRQLLRHGIPESDDEDWGDHLWPEENKSGIVKEEDDSLDNEDMTYITSILASLLGPKSYSGQTKKLDCAIFTPEGLQT